MRRTAALLGTLCLLAAFGQAGAVTTLEGYSELLAELHSDVGGDPTWELWNPKLYSELRLSTSPWTSVDAYFKMAAESNRWVDDAKDTEFLLKEGHLHYRTSHFETYVFARQDRFWLNEPLLEIMNSGVVKDDDWGPRAQGIRADFRDLSGFSGAAFYSDNSSADDFRGGRVTRRLYGDNVYLGSTYARKDYGSERGDFDELGAIDAELALGEILPPLGGLGRVTLITEYGWNSSGFLWGSDDSIREGFKTELRDVIAGPFRFRGSYETFDDDFYTLLASEGKRNLNDYSQYFAESHFRVPAKAINLRGWILHAEPEHPDLTSQARDVGTIDEWGGEAYVEFKNGFTGKSEYKVYQDDNGTWPNLFFEVTGENRLVKLRTQFRIRDIDTNYEVTAYGFEANVNLSERWKFYSRIMNVDERAESRQTAFAQLRYAGWNGAEFFVEFGNPDHSNDLVNDGDFVSHDASSTVDKVFKVFLKIYY